jgi:hypothetical protein
MGNSNSRGAYVPVPVNDGGANTAVDAAPAAGGDAKESGAEAKCGQCSSAHHGDAPVIFLAKERPAQFAGTSACPRCKHLLRDSSTLWVRALALLPATELPVIDADYKQGGLCRAPTGGVKHYLQLAHLDGSPANEVLEVSLCDCTHHTHWVAGVSFPRKLTCVRCCCPQCARPEPKLVVSTAIPIP